MKKKEEYFNYLIDFLKEPMQVEKAVKAFIVSYAAYGEQLQSLVGSARETVEFLNRINITSNPDPKGFGHFWVRQAFSMGYERFEALKDKIAESERLIQYYMEHGV